MATNLAISNELIEQAKEIGNHKTKKAAVTAALEEYIRQRKQLEVTSLFGQIDWDPDFDYKSERFRKGQ